MATVTKEFAIAASPDAVWDAVRDFHAVHRRVAPGFLTDAKAEGNDRLLTFFNGAVVRERLVGCDDATRRLAYTIVAGRYDHHHASVQVFPHPQGCRVVWITDLLPDTLAELSDTMMQRGMAVMQQTLASAGAAT